MKTFLDMAKEINEESLNEILLTRRKDYSNVSKKYIDAINVIFDNRKYLQMSIFKVQNKTYYCVLIMRGMFLEPHFGVFLEDKFEELQQAVIDKNISLITSLLKSEEFIRKDGYTDDDSDFVKIISYVFSIMCDYLDKKPVTDVKVMGSPKKFAIYKKLVKANLDSIPYKIIKDDVDDSYSNKYGDSLSAKAIHLKYNFA